MFVQARSPDSPRQTVQLARVVQRPHLLEARERFLKMQSLISQQFGMDDDIRRLVPLFGGPCMTLAAGEFKAIVPQTVSLADSCEKRRRDKTFEVHTPIGCRAGMTGRESLKRLSG